jgi:hypothetical protein
LKNKNLNNIPLSVLKAIQRDAKRRNSSKKYRPMSKERLRSREPSASRKEFQELSVLSDLCKEH